jgi:hypothetical protein
MATESMGITLHFPISFQWVAVTEWVRLAFKESKAVQVVVLFTPQLLVHTLWERERLVKDLMVAQGEQAAIHRVRVQAVVLVQSAVRVLEQQVELVVLA